MKVTRIAVPVVATRVTCIIKILSQPTYLIMLFQSSQGHACYGNSTPLWKRRAYVLKGSNKKSMKSIVHSPGLALQIHYIVISAIRFQTTGRENMQLLVTQLYSENQWFYPWDCVFSCDQAALQMVFFARLSVRLSHLIDYVPIMVSSWNFQELLPMTKVRSMQKVKVRGQRSRSQRSQPNLTVSRL